MEIPIFENGTNIRLFIKESDEVYQGIYLDGNQGKVTIHNVTDNKGNKLNGVYTYYSNEIERIQVKGDKSEQKEDEIKIEVAKNSNRTYEYGFPNGEAHCLQQIAMEAPIFYKVDSEFNKALNTLKEYESVALVALGISKTITKIQFIVLGTRFNTFIIDASKYTKTNFPEELKALIESDDICKVTYQNKILKDSLQTYQITINNSYDIQDHDFILTKKKSRNISEILQDLLNIPDSILFRAMETNKHIEKWSERPLRDTRRLSAALLAVFLVPAKIGFDYEYYKDVYKITRTVYDHVENMDSLQFLKSVYNNKEGFHKDVDNIIKEAFEKK